MAAEMTPAELAEFRAWKAAQTMGNIVEDPITLSDVLIALVHAARLPNEATVRRYIQVIRDAEAAANADTEGVDSQ